ncbi:protein of unknown function [Candidatus Nitrotoga arctica]|uniref:Uncharacterized protein n=1 Tax=Candidatus Nitrotoga arctica TaxID=453162 RepID=A0ABM8YY02_9PROT|nr:protein of unknown function [Candidatus Nitrotoga arctica]
MHIGPSWNFFGILGQIICVAVFVILDGLRDFHKGDEYQDFTIAANVLIFS